MIATLLGDTSDGAQSPWWEHHPVVVNQRVLVDLSKDVTARYVVADLRDAPSATVRSERGARQFETCLEVDRGEIPAKAPV